MPSNKSASFKRFPIGDLARKRKELKEDFLAAESETARLQNEANIAQKDVNKLKKRIKRHKESLALLEEEEQSLAVKRRKLEMPSKRKNTARDSMPTSLCQNNSEKISLDISARSARRRCKETLIACENVHGHIEGSNSAALDGMWVTLVNESTPKHLQSFFDTSRKIQDKVIPAITKAQVKEYEKSQDNLCRSLKVLYEDGLMSKKKYKSLLQNQWILLTSMTLQLNFARA
ncbi:uncharacterized protein LOC114526558 [Dendronephthya gigantea]|uniref:uncharacterized protein LOC114526558 n=1 Tax=Dendronephthya gigantea TaxID=151771 RepID=UPI00106CC2BD|nr:uncharacterized protein LOC114526558 [Dendronephthya gigantea]